MIQSLYVFIIMLASFKLWCAYLTVCHLCFKSVGAAKGLNDRIDALPLALVLPLGFLLLTGQPGLTHILQSFAGVHDKCQSHSGSAIAALSGKAQEGGPKEGAAAHESCPHVQRHQDEVEELKRAQGTYCTICSVL